MAVARQAPDRSGTRQFKFPDLNESARKPHEAGIFIPLLTARECDARENRCIKEKLCFSVLRG